MSKQKLIYTCVECGYETGKWMGKCPVCGKFNSLQEDVVELKKDKSLFTTNINNNKVITLKEIVYTSEQRISTNIQELDRVLSGGIVEGSLILLGGQPGIGKSTLILQVSQNIGLQNKKVLYISGEESVIQIKSRADRLNVNTQNLMLLSETNLGIIQENIKNILPDLVVIDSIQTIYNPEVNSVFGSISQIRESTNVFMNISKGLNIPIVIVGHVTKDGNIAGPKLLEHMVDTVLYFEGENHVNYKIIRAVKNRFGSTNEIGVFEMTEKGLLEITNPSKYMLSGRPIGVPGSAITCTIEGTRPILAEVQALVSQTNFGMPRRTATGMDYNRVVMLIAVLEKRVGMQLGNCDSYLNIAGGMKIAEPSLDASVISAIASSFKNKTINEDSIIFGEVGLTGEMRAVSMAEKRVKEASKLGFKKCFLPKANIETVKNNFDIEVIGVSNVYQLLNNIFE